MSRPPIPSTLLQRFNNRTLLLDPNAFDMFLAGDAQPPTQRDLDRSREYEVTAGVAVVPVRGVLMQRGSGVDWLDDLFGVASVESIQATFRMALADPSVSAILLDIDSPGGEVHGLFDLSDEIAAARSPDRLIVAVANEWCCSGGYLIACAADKIVLPRTGIIGSIGAMRARIDMTAFDQGLGVKYEIVTSGKRKSDGNPHVEMSDDERAKIVRDVNKIGRMFERTVARNRNTDAGDIRALEADIFRGKDGVDAGLADAESTFDATLKSLAATGGRRRGGSMGTKVEAPPAEPVGAAAATITAMEGKPTAEVINFEERLKEREEAVIARERTRAATIEKACVDAQMPELAELASVLIKDGVSVDQASIRIESARVIVAKCHAGGRPELAVAYITRGLTVEQAKGELFEAMVAANGPPTQSQHRPEVAAKGALPPTIDVNAVYDHYRAEMRRAHGGS